MVARMNLLADPNTGSGLGKHCFGVPRKCARALYVWCLAWECSPCPTLYSPETMAVKGGALSGIANVLITMTNTTKPTTVPRL